MSIRQNVFRIGETVEVDMGFTNHFNQNSSATSATIYIRKPNDVLENHSVSINGGQSSFDIQASIEGTWKIRVETVGGSIVSVKEEHFEVAPSIVLD